MVLDKIIVTIEEVKEEVDFAEKAITKIKLTKGEINLLAKYLSREERASRCLGADRFVFFYRKPHTEGLVSKRILESEFHYDKDYNDDNYQNKTYGRVLYCLTGLGYQVLKNLRKRKII